MRACVASLAAFAGRMKNSTGRLTSLSLSCKKSIKIETMKTQTVVAAALIGSAAAFAPQQAGRPATSLAEKKSIAARIFDMDLFAPVADQNDYGARSRKNLAQGKIGSNSYVPSGLSASEYNSIRDKEAAKKKANYDRNVAKAGKFLDYTKFYLDRGTDTSQSWFKSVTRGHRMAKTKYDWSGNTDPQKGYDGKA